jgi:hypothetical protein
MIEHHITAGLLGQIATVIGILVMVVIIYILETSGERND